MPEVRAQVEGNLGPPPSPKEITLSVVTRWIRVKWMNNTYAFSRESEMGLDFKMEVDRALEKLIDCFQEHLKQIRDEGDFLEILMMCAERTGQGRIFILNGDQDICEVEGAILVVPELTSASIVKALKTAERCARVGNHPIGGIMFLSKGSSKKFDEALSYAWDLFLLFGVMILRVRELKKQTTTTTRWALK